MLAMFQLKSPNSRFSLLSTIGIASWSAYGPILMPGGQGIRKGVSVRLFQNDSCLCSYFWGKLMDENMESSVGGFWEWVGLISSQR